jgi:hypothetical protein
MTTNETKNAITWNDRLRLMLLKETQVRGALERHAASAPASAAPALRGRFSRSRSAGSPRSRRRFARAVR